MAAGSSPRTSDRSRFTTVAGARAAARRPPLMADKCRRTALISRISAPQARRSPVAACLSARVSPGAGGAEQGRAAPGGEPQEEGPLPGLPPEREEGFRRADAGPVRDGMGRLHQPQARQGLPVPLLGHDHPAGQAVPQQGLQAQAHARAGLACAEGHDAVEVPEVPGRPRGDAEGVPVQGQLARQHGEGVHPRQGGGEDGAGGFGGGRRGHGVPSDCARGPGRPAILIP